MKTCQELCSISKGNMAHYDNLVERCIEGTYIHIEGVLCHPYVFSREKTIGCLFFHLKHMAFLCGHDVYDGAESLSAIVSKVSADMQILSKGKMKTIHDLSDDEWEQYLNKIVTLFYEEICK
jgi:hypothetical protein